MEKLSVYGGAPLEGTLHIGGAKNAALPLMCASLLTSGTLTLRNVPCLTDVSTLTSILAHHGVHIERSNPFDGCMSLSAEHIRDDTANYEAVRSMRASVLVLAPLVARHGSARVSLPGGCAIGARPVDVHLDVLKRLGADVRLEEGYIHAQAPHGLVGNEIVFPFVSVGGSENALMAATLAQGTTRLVNVAQEPEVTQLAQCLVRMGARIEGIGSSILTIQGVSSLQGAECRVIGDRIEAGSFAMAAVATRGHVRLKGIDPRTLDAVLHTLRSLGASVVEEEEELIVSCETLRGGDVVTAPYPGFPTDLQAQLMALLLTAQGDSLITESVFENRFMHVPELLRLGAHITLKGRTAVIRGGFPLHGAPVMATDLRASMSLIIAALCASGNTVISHVYHLRRGYELLEDKLRGCGTHIRAI